MAGGSARGPPIPEFGGRRNMQGRLTAYAKSGDACCPADANRAPAQGWGAVAGGTAVSEVGG